MPPAGERQLLSPVREQRRRTLRLRGASRSVVLLHRRSMSPAPRRRC
jgi:hypothetical protein